MENEALQSDANRTIRIKLFKRFVTSVYTKCKQHFGQSKYQDAYPQLTFNTEEEDIMGGYFDYDDNEIIINYQGFDDSEECSNYYTRLITHEYIHYLQYGVWFKRYYRMGHDYLSHPYEIEAYARETELLNN